MDSDDAPGARRGVQDARVLAVLEERLAAADGVAFLNSHTRLHAGEVVRYDSDAGGGIALSHDVDRPPCDREVEPLLDFVNCHPCRSRLLFRGFRSCAGCAVYNRSLRLVRTRRGRLRPARRSR